ncbi:MAG: flagellin [Myxococcota bacterium]
MLKNISHNLSRRINTSVKKANRVNEQLSTGKRVNRAADDAAGLALACRANTRAASISRANQNINEAMSAIQLAEAGSSVIYDNLTKMLELAIQANNGIYSDEERNLLQMEYSALQESIQSISLGSSHQDHLTVLNAGWVQLAFAIDVSGSMGGEIANLKTAINGGSSSLASLLENNDIYTQFSITAVGNTEDPSDGADTRAILGSPDFSDALDGLSHRGQLEDPYSAITSMIGGVGNDNVQFASIADQRHIVYITDTGLERSVSPATKASTQAALEAAGITFHGIRSGGGPGALDALSDATGGTKNPLAGDGSNISSVLDDINDIILDAAESKRPTAMMFGPDAADSTDVDVPVNMSLNALKLTFTSSDIKTRDAANLAIHQVKEAIEYYNTRRTMLGAAFNRLQSALEINSSRHLELKSHAFRIEDADLAKVTMSAISTELKAKTSTEMLQKFFQIKSTTLSKLFR